MQPLDDRTTCYTLIFWYFETADPTRVQLCATVFEILTLEAGKSLILLTTPVFDAP